MANEKPILFSGPMIRALLSGSKTQTRRVVKGLPGGIKCASAIPESNYQYRFTDFNGTNIDLRCPYGRPQLPLEPPRDHLWVRETFAPHPEFHVNSPDGCIFRADRGGDYQGAAQGDFKWKPSIFMPRWASRITLEITNVRVERLQDISEADIRAEGIDESTIATLADHPKAHREPSLIEAWCHVWDSINAKRGYGWDANPWVWCISFQRLAT